MTASARTLFALLALAPLLSACPSSVLDDYEAAREAALAEADAPGPNWKPDAVLALSPALLDQLVGEALRQGGAFKGDLPVQGPLGVKGTVTPDLVVDALTLSPSKDCTSCVAIDADLSGTLAWRLGPTRGSVPVDASVGLDTEIEAVLVDDGWQVLARPAELRTLELDFGRGGATVAGAAEGPVKDWLRQLLRERVEPVPIALFEAEELPLRALRVEPSGAGLRVEMLTTASKATAAKIPTGVPDEGWRLHIAPESILAIARRASFEAGPVSHDVVVEPTSLALSPTGFDMDMRLWRIKGKGWWRDYHTEGDLEVDGAKLKLTPRTVEERGKSAGAVFVDPIAALGHGVILKAIEDSLQTSVPGVHRTRGDSRTTEVRITEVDGTGAMVRMSGTLTFKDSPTKDSPTKDGPTKGPATDRPAVGGSKGGMKR